jgi:hypothetical protein
MVTKPYTKPYTKPNTALTAETIKRPDTNHIKRLRTANELIADTIERLMTDKIKAKKAAEEARREASARAKVEAAIAKETLALERFMSNLIVSVTMDDSVYTANKTAFINKRYITGAGTVSKKNQSQVSDRTVINSHTKLKPLF